MPDLANTNKTYKQRDAFEMLSEADFALVMNLNNFMLSKANAR